ncbi:bcl-2/adenovirus E1B 19 kDa-interacting protein 2-like protein isoform X2 [Eleutherodactylus coqui]|uniref:bcl-2/adenovirus E1B 19 kDa-interacting protein 2-like protein isoform X2 n=1 Tax=Eleutherodactylus coqui TaxID=57060 RepID=UPI003462FB58
MRKPHCYYTSLGTMDSAADDSESGSLQRSSSGVAEQSEDLSSAHLSIDDMELKEEWQDEEFPRPLPEETAAEEDLDPKQDHQSASPPTTLQLCGNRHMKRRLPAPDFSFNLDDTQESTISSDICDQTTDEDFDIGDLETPSSSELLDLSHAFEWEDDLPKADKVENESFVENRVTDEQDESGRKWRIFLMGEHKVDMTAIEPYRKVISDAGYYGDGLNAIFTFSSCYLPESNIPDYQYIMDHLFRYIIGTLDLVVAEDYVMVYMNGCTPRNKIPPMSWVKRCYQATGRRLKKNLKSVLIVHPTWYVKALLIITRPFISAKFGKKVKFVNSLVELAQLVPLDNVHVPDCIDQLDRDLKR